MADDGMLLVSLDRRYNGSLFSCQQKATVPFQRWRSL
jgi:hypothetical protein